MKQGIIKSMKSTLILGVLATTMAISCSGNENTDSLQVLISKGDLSAIRAKRSEISVKQKDLDADLKLLDSVLNAKDNNKKIPLVTTYEAKKQEFNHFIELQGGVNTKQNVLVYPEVAGTLVKVNVKEGQKVTKGQILGVVDNGGLNNQLSQLKTQYNLAKTTYERQKRLWEQKVGTEMQFLQAEAQYQAQKDAVKQMEEQLDKFNVRSPFSGVVDDVIKAQGSNVSPGPGSEMFRVVNLSDMYVEVYVPESYIANITVGKEVRVNFPVIGETIQSKVRQTGNFINPNNRSFTVEIPVPNKDGNIKPNLTAKVQINDYHSQEAILIPQGVISENAEGEQYTYLVSSINGDKVGVANKKVITTGKTQGDYVEVLSGLEEGDQVIEEGARSVKDGQEVKILSK